MTRLPLPSLALAGLVTLTLSPAGCHRAGKVPLVTPVEDRPRPELSVELGTLDHRRVSLSSFVGRVVLVNFFSTDCLPCVEEVPILVELQREYGRRGFQVVGVSMDLYPEATLPLFVERFGVRYPVLLAGPGMDTSGTPFGRIVGLPSSVLLDRTGAVAGSVVGSLDEARVRAAVELLLGEGPGAPGR